MVRSEDQLPKKLLDMTWGEKPIDDPHSQYS